MKKSRLHMNGFTDIHHHIVYGMDDGARTLEDSKDMLRAAAEDGVCRIVATPHASPGRRAFDMTAYLRRISELNAYCAQKGVGVELYPGAEIFYTEATLRFLEGGMIPTLAGTRHVLVEFATDARYETLQDAASALCRQGYTPVFAHIERFECLTRKPSRVYELKETMGVLMQVDAEAVVRTPFLLRRFMKTMIGDRVVDFIASDAHNIGGRRSFMRQAYDIIGKRFGPEIADDLFIHNQAMLLPAETALLLP